MLLITALVAEILLVVLDQVTKIMAAAHLKPVGSMAILDGVFQLSYVENNGAAFGVLSGARWLFLLLTPAVLCVIAYYYVTIPKGGVYRWIRAALILIAAGAAGNLIDRLFRGFVVDFLYFSLIDFPVFNVADCYVVVGTGLLGVLLLFFLKEGKAE